MEEDVRRSLEAGFDHHLTKPIEFDALQSSFATSRSSLGLSGPARRGMLDAPRAAEQPFNREQLSVWAFVQIS
jgi:CheY-like chemotaxis protein